MKTSWIVLVGAVLSVVNIARAADFVPPHGVCALGRVAELRQVGPNRWTIELVNIRVLLQDRGPGETATGETARKILENVTVTLPTGLGGVLVTPMPEWTGRIAVFCAVEDKGTYAIPNMPLPLSPNGASFMVFTPDQAGTIQFIEEVASILNLTSPVTQLQRLAVLVESPAQPLFLQRFAVGEVARLGLAKSESEADTRTQISQWRDSERLSPELRVHVDDVLVDHSPRAYQWGADRFSFIRKLEDAPGVSSETRDKVTRRKHEAERLKSSETVPPLP